RLPPVHVRAAVAAPGVVGGGWEFVPALRLEPCTWPSFPARGGVRHRRSAQRDRLEENICSVRLKDVQSYPRSALLRYEGRDLLLERAVHAIRPGVHRAAFLDG